ncbi:unnamed protein product [Rhizopus stolonifer]
MSSHCRIKRSKYLQDSCSVASFSTSTSSENIWLPPIASLLLPPSPPSLYIRDTGQIYHKDVYMPMVPYFFHHKQFGIEACMLQLMEARRGRYH